MKFEDESDDLEDEGAQNVEKCYKGIHLNFPMKRQDLDLLIDSFRKKKVSNTIFQGSCIYFVDISYHFYFFKFHIFVFRKMLFIP